MAEIYLVEFKGSRKEFFFNSYYHSLKTSDYVITEAERGEDIGRLSKKIEADTDVGGSNRPRSILRPASEADVGRMHQLRNKEETQKGEAAEMIGRHGLEMKVVDVECQFDNNKMTIFFTADHRVDFRELVKDLAGRYRTRIELRQIGVRDEARRVGGTGICGKEQCCNSFLTEFKPISTQHARDQGLPLNPAKISGNCGRLLCCLRFEADMYTAVKRKFPSTGTRVTTEDGDGVVVRIDIFREEAVIRTEDGLIRARAKDIVEVSKTAGKKDAIDKTIMEEYEQDGSGDRDQARALRNLDNEEKTG